MRADVSPRGSDLGAYPRPARAVRLQVVLEAAQTHEELAPALVESMVQVVNQPRSDENEQRQGAVALRAQGIRARRRQARVARASARARGIATPATVKTAQVSRVQMHSTLHATSCPRRRCSYACSRRVCPA